MFLKNNELATPAILLIMIHIKTINYLNLEPFNVYEMSFFIVSVL